MWIIGAGHMARAYCDVLKAMNVDFQVIGRGEESAQKFEDDYGVAVSRGGLSNFLASNPEPATSAIICTPVEQLSECAMALINAGVKKVLLEKPGALSVGELSHLKQAANEQACDCYIGYNRRFYQATLAAEKVLVEDGGITAFNFEITEWGHVIDKENVEEIVKQTWFYGNTSHVVDLAFFVGGTPLQINSFTQGSLSWHSKSSRFAGAGLSEKNAVFNYGGYWDGPGRWSVEFVTTQHRLIMRPMEKLQIQKLGSVAVAEAAGVDYHLDEEFKPGVYKQTEAFINGDFTRLCSLETQIKHLAIYCKMAGYE